MNRKFVVSSIFLLIICGLIFFLWRQAILLSVLLLLVAYIKHRLYPIKLELLLFVSICISGAIIEGILVNVAGVWTYASPHVLNVPLWMPLFWGTAGTTLIAAYEGLTEQKNKS
jgi:hypothetical protein